MVTKNLIRAFESLSSHTKLQGKHRQRIFDAWIRWCFRREIKPWMLTSGQGLIMGLQSVPPPKFSCWADVLSLRDAFKDVLPKRVATRTLGAITHAAEQLAYEKEFPPRIRRGEIHRCNRCGKLRRIALSQENICRNCAWPPVKKFDKLCSEVQLKGKRRQAIFDAWAHSCRRRGITHAMISDGQVLLQGLQAIAPPQLFSWQDVVDFGQLFDSVLTKSAAIRARRELNHVATQLVLDNRLKPRLRRGERAICQSCESLRSIFMPSRMLCSVCMKNHSSQQLWSQIQLQGKRRNEIFDAWLRSCQRLSKDPKHCENGVRLAQGLQAIKPSSISSWDYITELKQTFADTLPKSAALLACRALNQVAEQLELEGQLPSQVKRGDIAVCSSCGKDKEILLTTRLLCKRCSAKWQCQQVYSKYSFGNPAQIKLFKILHEYEQKSEFPSVSRMRAMARFIERHPSLPLIESWTNLVTLRNLVEEEGSCSSHGYRRLTRGALNKIVLGLTESRCLRAGDSPMDQLHILGECFISNNPTHDKLIQDLISYFTQTRITDHSIRIVASFADYLNTSNIPEIDSWKALDEAQRAAPKPIIQWAYRHLGDALVYAGKLSPRISNDPMKRCLDLLDRGPEPVRALNEKYSHFLHRHGYRSKTLCNYVAELNRFWNEMFKHGIVHPTQISQEHIDRFVAESVDSRHPALRSYLSWLSQQREILYVPHVHSIDVSSTVRTLVADDLETIIEALFGRDLQARDAFTTYLLIFHGLSNWEIREAKAIGFEGNGVEATFNVDLPFPIFSVGKKRPTRSTRLSVPTGRYPWLHDLVIRLLQDRAHRIKQPSAPYLFLPGTWRSGGKPMHPTAVFHSIKRVSRTIFGNDRLTPTLLRCSGATYFSDASDYTICMSRLGRSQGSAVAVAYAPREYVTVKS